MSRLAVGLILILLAPRLVRAEKVQDLKPQGYVNDFGGVLLADDRTKLTALCGEVDQKTHAQIAVVTIHTLEDDTPQDFANRLFKQWGIGPKSGDRGVLILLAVRDRKYWVEVGYGLEPILPDGKVGGFGREIVPLLRQGDYSAALLQLTSSIAGVIAQASGVTLDQKPPPRSARPQPAFSPAIPFLIFLAFMIFVGFLRRLARPGLGRWGRGSGWWMGGGPWIGGGFGGGLGGGGGFGGGGGGGFGGFGGGASGGGGAGGSW